MVPALSFVGSAVALLHEDPTKEFCHRYCNSSNMTGNRDTVMALPCRPLHLFRHHALAYTRAPPTSTTSVSLCQPVAMSKSTRLLTRLQPDVTPLATDPDIVFELRRGTSLALRVLQQELQTHVNVPERSQTMRKSPESTSLAAIQNIEIS